LLHGFNNVMQMRPFSNEEVIFNIEMMHWSFTNLHLKIVGEVVQRDIQVESQVWS